MPNYPDAIEELHTYHKGIFVVYVKHPTEDKIIPLRVDENGSITLRAQVSLEPLGAVEIQDETSQTRADVVAIDSQISASDNYRGFLVLGSANGVAKAFPLTADGSALVSALFSRDVDFNESYRAYSSIDAGAEVELDAVEVSKYLTKTFFVRSDSDTVVFKVQCSFDGTNWFDVSDWVGMSGNSGYFHRFSTTDAFKYLRVVIKNADTSAHNAGAAYCLQV